MENKKQPTRANGKICYLEIPARDIKYSAIFYKEVFGWQIRENEDGGTSFDDTVGEVSGSWVTNREPLGENSLQISIMVDSIAETLDMVALYGGKIVQAAGVGAYERTARFADPAGNMMVLYQSGKSK